MSLCSIRGTSSGKRILLKLIMITAALLGAVQCEAETLTGRVSVIDGDTLRVSHDGGQRFQRMMGVHFAR